MCKLQALISIHMPQIQCPSHRERGVCTLLCLKSHVLLVTQPIMPPHLAAVQLHRNAHWRSTAM